MESGLRFADWPGAELVRRGKVRDIFRVDQGLLIVATDRISAFDVVMPTPIPGKGKVLTQMTLGWLALTQHLVADHLITADVAGVPGLPDQAREMLNGRAMVVREAEVIPVECVVRGYLSGSGWALYRKSGEVSGVRLPAGMVESERLPEPTFTPSTKAESGHDEAITLGQAAEMVGQETAEQVRDKALALYSFAADYAAEHGLILADTKFEFGWVDGELALVDEVLTPDSSRFWDAADYEPGRPQRSFDKQFVRDYLESLDWDKTPPGPELPPEIVARTIERYEECWRRLFGGS